MANVPQHIQDLIKQEEGFRDDVYADSNGYSAGYGHFLSPEELEKYPPGSKVPHEQIEAWFEEDIQKSYNAAVTQNNELAKPVEVGRLTSVNYQLGEAWNDSTNNPRAFTKTWDLMKSGDFTKASTEVLDSEWATTQTPTRAKKFSDALATLGTAQMSDIIYSSPAAEFPTSLSDNQQAALETITEPPPIRPEPTSPTPTTTSSPIMSMFSGVMDTPSRPPTTSMGPGSPGTLVGQAGQAQAIAAEGFTSPYADQNIRITPADAGDRFKEAVHAGSLQLEADVERFGAIYNLLTGDQEVAEAKLKRAELINEVGGEMLTGLGTFEAFLDEPTVGGFFDQVSKAVGQFTPMAVSSISTGLTGAAVQMLGKGLLTTTSRKVTNEVMKDIVKKHVAHKNGRGPALTASEKRILDSAYATARNARTAGMGARLPDVVAAGTRPAMSINPLNYQAGFWVGAGTQEYVVGSAQSLAEFEDAGRELTAEEAKLALAMGIPQAALGLLSERLFVGDIFKRVSGKHADAVRRGATKQADEYAGWMKEMARGVGSGFAKGASAEGLTELAQEELFIQQRFAIDPNYSSTEANLRRAESAFAGFFAGGTARGAAGGVGNVMGKARALMAEGPEPIDAMLNGLEDIPRDGSPINEPASWSAAQVDALLDEGTGTRAVWLPNATTAQVTAALTTAVKNNPALGKKRDALGIIVGINENKGVLIYDQKALPDAKELAVETDFSDSFLQEVLGYTQPQNPTDTQAVIVRDKKGNVVWSQSTSEANVDATIARANELFPNREKYNAAEAQFKEDAVKERWQKSQEEGQQEFDFGEETQQTQQTEPQTERQPTQEEGPAPQQQEFDFTDRSMIVEGGPQTPKSPAGMTTPVTEQEGNEVAFTEGGTTLASDKEGFITKPLTKAEQSQMTEEQIVAARENRPVMAWTPRNPDELTDATTEEVNVELDKREGLEKFFATYNEVQVEDSPGIVSLLASLPTNFLETFKAQARLKPNLILTPKQNENGDWTIATSPRDVLPGDRINAAERIRDVVIDASRQPKVSRDKTPGWSVKSPDGQVREVYMGTLVQFGIQLGLNAPKEFVADTGRIVDGFTRMYEAIVENGYDLLYEGKSIKETDSWQTAPIYQLAGGRAVSLNQAQEGRSEIQDPTKPTDAELQQELDGIQAKLDARQRYFDEREANPGIPADMMQNQYVEVTQEETARKFEIERELNKGFVDRGTDIEDVSDFRTVVEPGVRSADKVVTQAMLDESVREVAALREAGNLEASTLAERGYKVGDVIPGQMQDSTFSKQYRPDNEPSKILSDDQKDTLALTSLNIEGPPTYDPIMDTLQREQSRRGPRAKKGKVDIDASWNSVMGGLWPQLSSIISNKLGYGGRTTRITTAENVLNDENFLKPKNKPQETVTFEGQKYAVSDLVKQTIQGMREKGELGKYIRFGDTDLIVIDVPANPTPVQQVKSILALGHELGHAIFHQELNRSLDNPKLRKDLEAAFKKDKEAGIGGRQYEGELGFEEWFSDQMGTWLLREAKKPKNGVESFFKRLADKIRSVFTSLDANLNRRFKQNEAFDDYVNEVIKSYQRGKGRNAPLAYSDRVVVRNMVDEMGATIKGFMPKKALQQIKRKTIDLLEVKEELMPSDRRHWSVAYILQPGHNYLKGKVGKYAPELANGIYSMSQSEGKTGHLNARVLLMYQRLNNLYKLAPTKKTITGKVVPDLDAFETTLREAEQNVPKEQLSPEAQQVRQYLDDFYENYIRGNDAVFKRDNFYPRIIAIAELQANQQVRDDLVALLKEFNKDGPDDIVIYNLTGEEISRTPGSFEKVVEAMIREGEDNTDNPRPDVADVAIGTNESRAKYFRDIPNERLRDIGALTEANTAIRRYIEDMTKRLDYMDKFKATLTRQDIANIKAQGPAFRQSFAGKKLGDEVDGWQAVEALLLRVPDETNRAAARDALKAMLGKTGLNMSPAMRQINSALMTVNIMTYLTFATLASLPDLAGPVLRSKDLSWQNLQEGFTQVRRYFNETQEMQQFARDVGVITFDSLSTSIMQANELGFMTPEAQKYSDLFFKAIGLEWYTNFTRVFASGMGEQFLIRQASETSERSTRFLNELQVSKKDIQTWDANGRSFSTPEGQRVQMAIGRFVEESIVRPNAAERPVWASNPYTQLVWQLKSFFYAYGKNIVGGAMRESKSRYSEDGTISSASIPYVLGALTLLPLTMLGFEMREWFKYVGRGFDESAFRSDNMNWLPYTGELIDRAGILGPYGLVLPMFEAGKYGNSFITPALGPTAERVEDLVRGNAKWSDYMPGYGAVR